MYLIQDKHTKKSLYEKEKNGASDSFIKTSILEKNYESKTEDIYKNLEMFENYQIENVDKLNESSILIYTRVFENERTRNNINEELEQVIEHYNLVPSNITSTNYNISSFKFSLNGKTFYCVIDGNKISDLYSGYTNYKGVKKLCLKNDIPFKNQSLISYNKEKRLSIAEKKYERVQFSNKIRLKLFKRDNKTCKACKESIDIKNFEIDHVIPLACFGTNENDNLQCLCKACHSLKTEIEKESGSYSHVESQTHSVFNQQVQKIMNSNLYQSRAFIEKINPEEVINKVFHIDINKCRTNILKYGKYNFPKFSVMDGVEVYNSKIHNKTGVYYIESNNYTPLHGNGWYYLPMVNYCLENKIITHDNIKFTIQSSFEIPNDFYNDYFGKYLSIESMIYLLKSNNFKIIDRGFYDIYKKKIEITSTRYFYILVEKI